MSKIKISAELSHLCPLAEVIEQASLLEDKGFYRVWVPDTVVSPWEAWLVASLITHHTSRLNIGLGVTNPYTRHPVVMAQMACTLQLLSNGRLTLSLGKGIARFLEKAGIKQQEKALEECLTILRRLTNGERTSFEGEAFRLDAVRLRTEPPKKKIPLYVAAMGPSGWETAARIADGVSTIRGEKTDELRHRYLGDHPLPVAVLVPFSLAKPDFFPNTVRSPDGLTELITDLEKAGFDEVIVAYEGMKDLELVAREFERR
ncbi:MAG: LLM class flavin-dependent oxidoreductase [Deltaproteobacteria bacterium]|nr:LLM class flavin-dependent oxidoreductase [Deltaproteobacteria bacterium]